MQLSRKLAGFAMAGCIAAAAAGCGGSSSASADSSPSTPGNDVPLVPLVPPVPPIANALVISGVVATGGPYVDAEVLITDRTGNIAGSGLTNAAGEYRIETNPLYRGPMVVTATRRNTVGGKDTLTSLTDTATSATVNVNTVTNLVAALTSVTGDPSKLSAELASGKVTFDEKTIAANLSKVSEIMEPIFNALGVKIGPLLYGPARANGTGSDLVLDAIEALITPNEDKTSTVEITLKSSGGGQQLPVIRFTNSTLLPLILSSNAITANSVNNQVITAASLPASGTSAQIADLLKRLNACYALPTTSRVNRPTGTGANVTAPECRSLFKDDNPVNYLHFGERVSATGAFSTLFSDSGTGTGFGQGTFESKQSNGDIVFSMVTVGKDLVSRNEESVAFLAPDGKLRLTGNQYAFAGSINPMVELHYFMAGNGAPYLSTGYNIKVPLQSGSDGNEISRVEVTSPRGTQYILVRGAEAMTLPLLDKNFVPELDDFGNPSPSGSAFLRLSSLTSGRPYADVPSDMPYAPERNLYSAKKSETNEMIEAYLPRGAWTFKYFKLQRGGAVLAATQIVRTRARAPTIPEALLIPETNLLTNAFKLSNDSLNSLKLRILPPSSPSDVLFFPLRGLDSLSYEWKQEEPGNATTLLPFATRIYGYIHDYSSIPPVRDFSESFDLTPKTRKAKVTCSYSLYFPHCDPGGDFVSNAWLDGIQLLSRDALGRELSTFASTAYLP